MADTELGRFKQYTFKDFIQISENKYKLSFPSGVSYKIGISISEKEFMKEKNGIKILFKQNNEMKEAQIQIGRTYMYQPGNEMEGLELYIEKELKTILIDVVYMISTNT